MPRHTKAEKAEALAYLRRTLHPGDTVYTVLRSIARSGMSREIDAYTIKENRPVYLSGTIAAALDYRQSKQGALIVSGCGSDMGFEVVYNTGRVIFPDGGPLEHSPRRAQEERLGATIESDGGYLLAQSWL